MRFNDCISLFDRSFELMPDGTQRPVESEPRRVLCNRMSIGLSARLAGAAEGLRGAVRVRVRAREYRGEGYAVADGREMTVEAVSSNGEFATLTLAERLGNDG